MFCSDGSSDLEDASCGVRLPLVFLELSASAGCSAGLLKELCFENETMSSEDDGYSISVIF